MKRSFAALAIALVLISYPSAAPVPKGTKFSLISLKEKGNHAITDPLGRGLEGCDLNGFPTGQKTFGDVPFDIGEKFLHLKSTIAMKFPEKIEGVAVNSKCDKLHLLHAACFGGGVIEKGSPMFCEDGTDIGEYVVHYDDKTSAKIPIVYGKDVRDWFFMADQPDPERAKTVWKGENEMNKTQDTKCRVYLSTWINSNPQKKIVSIDYVSFADKTPCAPFCLGITAETK